MSERELNGLFCRAGFAGPIGPAVNDWTGVKWPVLSRSSGWAVIGPVWKECISTVGLSLLNVIHQIAMPDRHHIREGFAGPIGPAVNEGLGVKWPVLSRQIGQGFAGPIGPAVNERIGVKTPILSRQIWKELISITFGNVKQLRSLKGFWGSRNE